LRVRVQEHSANNGLSGSVCRLLAPSGCDSRSCRHGSYRRCCGPKCGFRQCLIAVPKPQPPLATMVDGAPGFRYHNTPSRTLAVFLGLCPASRMTSGTSTGCSTSGGCSRDQEGCDAVRPAPQLWTHLPAH
jgi:hypothetical protein